MAVAGLRLPFLSEADPALAGEGTLDPLGLASLADRLAEEIAPGVTARMSRVRFVTAIAAGAVATEKLQDVVAADGASPAYLAYEWHVIEAIARDTNLPPAATRAVPGIQKTRAAIARGVRLDAASYLKTPKVFGFHGVYKRLARACGLVDDQLLLAGAGDRLLRSWELEQELDGFADRRKSTAGGRLAANIDSGVREALAAGKVTLSLRSYLWSKLVRALRPDTPGRNERRIIYELITSTAAPMRRELIEGLSMLAPDLSEAEALRALRPGASLGLAERLDAIDAYERVAELLTGSFLALRRASTGRGATPVEHAELHDNQVVSTAAQVLPEALDTAHDRLDRLGLGPNLFSSLGCFEGLQRPEELVEALLGHHTRVQAEKPPGKRPWFEITPRGFMVRPLYRSDADPVIDGTYIHPYRVGALRSFLADLG